VALVASIIVLTGGAFGDGFFTTGVANGDFKSDAAPAPPVPRMLSAAGSAPRPAAPRPSAPIPHGLNGALASLAVAPALGPRLRASIVDVSSGAQLYQRSPGVSAAPASTAKLLTAAAVLTVHKATDRITTRVVAGGHGTVVLVGAGDPTLSAAAAGKPTAYQDAARISDLAAQLKKAGVRPRAIVVDDSLFTGPTVSPAWAPEDVPSDYASPVTAALADGGRAAPDDVERSTEPDLAAGRALAAALGQPGIPVSRGRAAAGARPLAAVSSAPIGTLVEQMLQLSDNVLAECLARQVALAEHQPASFVGAVGAVRSVLTRLGVDPGAGMLDGSGLAAADRLTAPVLARTVRLAAGGAHPQLHAVVAGLPVAAWSGTLADRFGTDGSRVAAGVVRAKTGTLTGVATLAGLVHDRDGRLLAFAFLADRTGPTADAEAALDALIARLAACGCR
jgi:D-alanyl-D-alanine carboxypeptidase/D-alanyl-D-alanine-endopeptidase (penicillin-binding protein 4)